MMRRCFYRTRSAGAFLALLYLTSACSDGGDKGGDVLLAADPSGIYKGENVNIHLISEKAFFTEDTADKAVSDGGLILRGLKRVDDTHAVAALETDEDTTVGLHTLVVEMGGAEGTLQISVLKPAQGPGEVSVENNAASTGVEFARLTIVGEGTRFDPKCTLTAADAPGFAVKYLDVETPTEMSVHFAISRDQEPMETTLVLMDGDYRYEIPFTITAHQEFENEITDQVLTKGQVGNIVVFHEDATLYSTTTFEFEEDDPDVEIGEAKVGTDRAAVIPVRVPSDVDAEVLHLTAKTFSTDGSFLELVHLDVTLAEPAYAVLKEAKFEVLPGEFERVFEVGGIRARDVETISVVEDTALLSVVDWQVEDTRLGSLSLYLSDEVGEGAHDLEMTLVDGRVLYTPFAVSDWETKHARVPDRPVHQGDRVLVPIAVQAGDFNSDTLAAEGNDDVTVEDVLYIDGWTAVLDLTVAPNAFPSTKYLTVHGETYDYGISIDVVESGV